MKILSLTNISQGFKESIFTQKEIFKEINFEIKTGEFVALKGENGSGKTTLLNIILGLITPKKGKVRLQKC
jgi:ABC-type multidrug transport system ATPase subunit